MLRPMRALEEALARPLPPASPDLDAHLAFVTSSSLAGSIDRAVVSGLAADRLGYAFAGGYTAAIARLFARAGLSGPPLRACLAATEAGGARPRDIETRVTITSSGARVDGAKTFATLASKADEILVFAWDGARSEEGHKRLRLVRVPGASPGVTLEAGPETPFAPEIPHAILRLDGVLLPRESVLPGDGYAEYVKPFRTIEDAHVMAATAGLLLRFARTFAFSPAAIEALVAALLAIAGAAEMDPTSPVTHVALAGALGAFERWIEDHAGELEKVDGATRAMWERDRPLLLVASKARTLRLEAARARLSGAGA